MPEEPPGWAMNRARLYLEQHPRTDIPDPSEDWDLALAFAEAAALGREEAERDHRFGGRAGGYGPEIVRVHVVGEHRILERRHDGSPGPRILERYPDGAGKLFGIETDRGPGTFWWPTLDHAVIAAISFEAEGWDTDAAWLIGRMLGFDDPKERT